MKKIIVFIFFFSTANIMYAQTYFFPIRQIGFMPCSIGMTISDNNTPSFDFDISLFYFSGEFIINSKLTGIGITWIPLNYKYIQNNHYLNLVNFQIYWNIFEILRLNKEINNNTFFAGSIFGPFASINCALNLSIPRIPEFKDYIFSAGLRYTFTGRPLEGAVRRYFFNLECGYRNISGQNSFYMSMGIDIYYVMDYLFYYLKTLGEK